VHQSRFAEDLDKSQYVGREYQYTIDTAHRKAIDVAQLLTDQKLPYDLIIACDTVICMDDKILEKPTDAIDAESMLTSLSGRQHIVYTGVALIRPSPSPPTLFYESATVRFGRLEPQVIRAYVETCEPLDKAGSYGIMAQGALLVDSIDGDFYTIVGMPLRRLLIELQKMLCE